MTFLELLLKTAEAPLKMQQGRSDRFCWMCNKKLTSHQLYRDGGHKKRAHQRCIMRAAEIISGSYKAV